MTAQQTEATYEAMNPIGEREVPKYFGINPRLDKLDGKKIGLFDNAKRECPFVLGKIEKLLIERYPAIQISWFKKGTYKEVMWEAEKAWAKDLDGVIGMCGD